jgi:hypothetical protein
MTCPINSRPQKANVNAAAHLQPPRNCHSKETEMVTRNEAFPSRFLKPEDLKSKPWVVQIEAAPQETLNNPDGGKRIKTVLYFAGAKKALPLNRVNWDSTAAIAGGETNDWPGHWIELFPTMTDVGGKPKDCIRIRPPHKQQPQLEPNEYP